MKHYVITKIAVGKDKEFLDTLPLRNEIFNNYLLPSIQEQECQEFEWLLLFDEDIDIGTLEQYKEYGTIVITKGGQWKNNIAEYIKKNNNIGEIILSTRLDSDDYIHPGFIKTINSFYIGCESQQLLALCTGSEMDYNTKEIYSYEKEYSNPFITLKEIYDGDIKTVYHLNHGQMEKEYKCKYIFTEQPMRCRILHGYNAARKEVLPSLKKLSN